MERFMQEKKLFATKKESSNKALLNFEKKKQTFRCFENL